MPAAEACRNQHFHRPRRSHPVAVDARTTSPQVQARPSGLEAYRVVVETLTDEHDLMEVALAAVRLAHESLAGGGDDDVEIARHLGRVACRCARERAAQRRDSGPDCCRAQAA